MLARYGTERRPEPTPPGEKGRADLAEMTGRRDQLKRMETQEKNRRAKTRLAAVKADIDGVLADLATRIRRIERAIDSHLAAHPDLARDAALLATIPGIGPVASSVLPGAMPELGSMDRRQAASLEGLAPRARESGRWTGTRHLGDGRRIVRRVLYMAAVSLTRRHSPFAATVQRLRNAGKPGKVIVIALARKILTIANAVLRDQKPFQCPA